MVKKSFNQTMPPLWKSDINGRSFFGLVIKEEIFGVFFVLTLLCLFNDEKIVEKISNNIYAQGIIIFVAFYLVYQKIPLSLAFIILFIFLILFSDFFKNVKGFY